MYMNREAEELTVGRKADRRRILMELHKHIFYVRYDEIVTDLVLKSCNSQSVRLSVAGN